MIEREAEEKQSDTGARSRHADLLAALLEAETENGEEFTEEEAVDFILALLVAGYDTTSTIMILAVKYLADHPPALALLRVCFSPHFYLCFCHSPASRTSPPNSAVFAAPPPHVASSSLPLLRLSQREEQAPVSMSQRRML